MPTIKYKDMNGKSLPGVTTILSNLGWSQEALMFWANKIGIEKGISHRDKSLYEANIGSLIHAYIERAIWKKIDENKLKKK